jgi:VanZ family protein
MPLLIALNQRYWFPITLALIAAVTVMSLIPLPELPMSRITNNDKVHHLLAYAALTGPVALARPPRWVWWIAGFFALGVAIEILQPNVNRHGSVKDVIANTIGITAGLATAAIARGLARRLEARA